VTKFNASIKYAGVGRTNYIWGDRRFSGLSDHPNHLGYTILICVPIVIYFMSRMRHKWIPSGALIVLALGLLPTGSRAAQALAPVFAVAAILCIPKESRGPAVRAASVTVFAAISIAAVSLFTILADKRANIWRITGAGADAAQGANDDRIKVFKQAWTDWQTYPVFGAGIRHVVEAHNIALQLLAAGGIVLFGAMAVYFFCVLRDCLRLWKHGVVIARFLLLSVVAWLVFGLVENQLTDPELYFNIGCVAALSVTTALAATPNRLVANKPLAPLATSSS
jgi:O-antigen ligase